MAENLSAKQARLADIKVDKVADMKVDKVDDMDVDMVPNMLVDKMADMKVFKVADTVAGMNFSMICSYFLVSFFGFPGNFFWISWGTVLELQGLSAQRRERQSQAASWVGGSVFGSGLFVGPGIQAGGP